MDKLKALFLYSNKISKIKKETFNNLKCIELSLKKNEINEIEINSFNGMDNLKYLDLSSNKIKKIKNGTFNDLKNLEELILDQNEIIHVEENSFNGFNNLINLYLSSNRIQFINDKTFFNVLNIFIYKNKLIKIAPNTFIDCSNSIFLNLSHNYLDGSEPNMFDGLIKLKTLDLSFNSIKFINRYFLNGLDSLENIDLSNNYCKLIEPNTFINSKHVLSLKFDNNYINLINHDKVWSIGLSNLDYLSLSRNSIKSIESIKGNLHFLIDLKLLDLSYNLITQINENDFEFNLKLNEINLNNNLIFSIQNNPFMYLETLQVFKISNNSLNFFNLSLLNTVILTELDLNYNTLIFDKSNSLPNIKILNFKNVKFLGRNSSFEFFFIKNSSISELDLSNVDLKQHIYSFDDLTNLEVLKLRQSNINSLEELKLFSFTKLIHIDLSHNNLKYVESFSSV
jgi:hypothetical protein